ncbi:DUF6193 family natural product biosynthesis protein [Streptomyces tubercidicus]|uniref:DUF6193 family natural product biosynthesis protein n=1 Tax=Streptomyces tubercidicus TaxID=47759 RepID=UPI0034666BDA
MTAENEGPDRGDTGVLNADLYPDLVKLGGLASALIHASQENGIELGRVRPGSGSKEAEFVSAASDSDRGSALINLGVDRRWFSISIENDVHSWASGGTDDIVSTVKMLDAWRRGVTLQELNTLFPYMHFDEMAQAYETGDPVATQWNQLLTDGDPFFSQALLQKIHSNDRLRTLFPFLSHGTLRLARDHTDRTAGEIWITPLRAGGHRVESTTPGEQEKIIEPFDQLIEAAVEFLDRP